MDETNRLPHPDRDRPLHEVIEDFGRRLRPSGPDGEIDEWSVYDESFRRLVSWAEESGRFYQALQALKEGGREHDLTYQDSLAFVRHDVAVFDLRPANVVKTPDGLILPIDSIPVRLDEKARAILTHSHRDPNSAPDDLNDWSVHLTLDFEKSNTRRTRVLRLESLAPI